MSKTKLFDGGWNQETGTVVSGSAGEVCDFLTSDTCTTSPVEGFAGGGGPWTSSTITAYSRCAIPLSNLPFTCLRSSVGAGWQRRDIPAASFIFRRCHCSRAKCKGPFLPLRYRTMCSTMCCSCLFIVCVVKKCVLETFMIT